MAKITKTQKLYDSLKVGKKYWIIDGCSSSYIPAKLIHCICLEKIWCVGRAINLKICLNNRKHITIYCPNGLKQIFVDKYKAQRTYKRIIKEAIRNRNKKIEIDKESIKELKEYLQQLD